MIDVAYENVIQFDMIDNTLEGRDLLESKVSTTIGEGKNKEFKNVVKLYFDLDNLEEQSIFFETEKYVSNDYTSNKKYLLLQAPRGNSAYTYPSTTSILYLLGINFQPNKKTTTTKRVETIPNAKNHIYYLYEKTNIKKELKEVFFQILVNFYRYRILDKNVYLTLSTHFKNIDTAEMFDIKNFLKKYQSQNIFTIGYIFNSKKYLFCEDNDYVNFLITDKKKSSDDSKLKIHGVCDFCKETKKLINNFGAKPYPLKNLKNFTSTMLSIFYENKKNNLTKNIRCCVECFEKISQSDYKLDSFKIGQLKEIKVKSKNQKGGEKSKENIFPVYAFMDTPFKQDIDYEDIKYAMEYLFEEKNALDTVQKVVKNEEIFDEEWKIILNIFIVNRGSKKEKNETVLNLRNINPHLFKKYNQIFKFINSVNDKLTYRTWKGNFSDIFSTISKADKRVSFEVFEAFLNEKNFDTEGLIKRFLPLVKRKFIASVDEKTYQTHYRHLLLDIGNILIIDNLRKKEKILTFEIMNVIEAYENSDKKKLYRKKSTKEIINILGFEWSDLEIGLFDLGMIIQEVVSDIKSNKSTDIEKVFMRKINFTGMRVDEVMSYIGYLEQKFQDYSKFIYRLDNKRERLSTLGIALNQKEIDISPEKSAYLIAFGYELSTTIFSKIGAIVNKEKKENKADGN